jgi:hypothetical protein
LAIELLSSTCLAPSSAISEASKSGRFFPKVAAFWSMVLDNDRKVMTFIDL